MILTAFCGGLVALVSLPLSNSDWTVLRPLKTIERFGFDALSVLFPPTAQNPAVIVSGFDTTTENRLGSKWPVSRKVLAAAIQNASADGARRIVVDVLLEGPSGELEDDKALNDILKSTPDVILSCRFDTDAIATGVRTALIPPYYDEDHAIDFEQSAKIAFAELPLDEDGIVRRIEHYRSVAGETYPAMAFAAGEALDWSRNRLFRFSLPDSSELTGPDIATAAANEYPKGTFSGKVVFFGLTGLQQTKEFNDLFTLGATRLAPYKLGGAYRRQLPGVYAQAVMTEAILRQLYVEEASPILRTLLGVIFCGGIGAIASSRNATRRSLLNLAMFVALALLWIAAFQFQKLYLPLPSVGLTAITAIVWIGLQERHRLRAQWGRYLSPGMLGLLQESDHDVQPVKRTLTIVFADIRGFTKAAESMDPISTLKTVNEVFDRAVPIVHKHGGIIDKFLGDGFMAVFGFPESLNATPSGAVDAAIEISHCSSEFKIACGVATGEVAVGHVAGGLRREFTFIGNAVNVASRLQQLLPHGGVLIDISTFEKTDQRHTFSSKTQIIKGIEEEMVIYEWLGSNGSSRQ